MNGIRAATIGTLFVLVIAVASPVRADEPVVPETSFALPPLPAARPPILAGEVHTSAVVPVVQSGLCPRGAACIFGGGFGIGASLERRWPMGLGVTLGYDAWFLDSGGVYELALMQFLRAGVRWAFLPGNLVHPFVGADISALVLGDALRIATVGGAFGAEVGIEIELTVTISLRLALVPRILTTGSFVTPTDHVPRGEGREVDAAIALQAGLVLLESP